nr:MAG TPA: hypothetical protein [Caudoviricetes sp.]
MRRRNGIKNALHRVNRAGHHLITTKAQGTPGSPCIIA